MACALVAFASGMLVLLIGAGGVAAQANCAIPDALRTAGLLQEAEREYRQLATQGGLPSCARDGLSDIRSERQRRARLVARSLEDAGVREWLVARLAAAVRSGEEGEITRQLVEQVRGEHGLALARALKVAGYEQAADEVLADAIAANPQTEVPDDLRGLSDAGLHLSAAEALSQAGLDEAAEEELALALKEDPTLDTPEELASPTRRAAFWREWLGSVGPVLVTIAEIAVAVLAAVVLAVLLVVLLVRAARRLGRQLRIEPFTGGAEEKHGEALTAAVRENYGRLRDQGGGSHLTLIPSSGEEPSAELPKEVAEIHPSVGIAAALVSMIGRLIPSRERLVTAYLRPHDPVRGVGVTLTFGRPRGRVFEEITIWEAEYGPPASPPAADAPQTAYDRLAVPAAAWLLYQTGNHQRSLLTWLASLVRGPYSMVGTRDWRSYALFAVGAEDQTREKRPSARRRYLAALRRDPGNRGAQFNLAVADLQKRATSKGDYERAVDRLEGLRDSLEMASRYLDEPLLRRLYRGAVNRFKVVQEFPETARRHLDEPLWYRLRYTEAVAWLHPSKGNTRTAWVSAVDVCHELLEKRKKWAVRRGTKALQRFLEEAEARCLVVLASALVEEELPESRPYAEFESVSAVDRETLKQQLRAWATAPDDQATESGFDEATKHDQVAAYVRDKLAPLDAGASYNLACYHARRKDFTRAREQLHSALELGGPALARLALRDAALVEYREDNTRREEIEELLEALEDPKPVAEPAAPRSAVEQVRDVLSAWAGGR